MLCGFYTLRMKPRKPPQSGRKGLFRILCDMRQGVIMPERTQRGKELWESLNASHFKHHQGTAEFQSEYRKSKPTSAPGRWKPALIPAFRINETHWKKSGLYWGSARAARHTGHPPAFGRPRVRTCIPRGRGMPHARRVRSPNARRPAWFPRDRILASRSSRPSSSPSF